MFHHKRLLAILFICFLVLVSAGGPVFAQEQARSTREIRAVITDITSQVEVGNLFQYQFTAQSEYQEKFDLDTTDSFISGLGYSLNVGDEVLLEIVELPDENKAYFKDVIRTDGEYWILFVFVLLVVAIGLLRGILSLLGLVVTIGILFWFIFPQILSGSDPMLITVTGAAVILGVNMHLAHGFRMQTFRAYLSTLAGLMFLVFLTYVFVYLAHLTGFASEDAALLFWDIETVRLPVGILMAGIILGAVGVLDDIAVTQSEIVDELISANPYMTRKELFVRAMRIGRHHIASTINTLVLVYAGAALPMLLLFHHSSLTMSDFLNNELVAEEFVRTMAGTCALILTVPISTLLATVPHKVLDKDRKVP